MSVPRQEPLGCPSRGLRRWIAFVGVASTVLVALGVLGLAIHNLGNLHFWTDESSTLFTALTWPEPGGPPGDISVAWSGTMNGFLDPGLFHMLVRFWAINIGTSIEILRVLPFALFLIYAVSLYFLARVLRAPWYLAAAAVAIMMFENITPYYAFELRPYSGGLAASICIPLLAFLLLRSMRAWSLIVFLVGYLFLASMQYTSVSVSIGTAAFLFVAFVAATSRRSRIYIGVAIVALLAWLPVLYLVSRGNPIGDPHASVSYMDSTILRYQSHSEAIQSIVNNFLSFTALPRTVFLMLVPLAWWRGWLPQLRDKCQDSGRLIGFLWLYVLVATCVSAALAALGFIPWVLGTRWSITEVGLIGASVTGLVGLLVLSPVLKRPIGILLVSLACLGVCAAGCFRLLNYDRPGNLDYITSLAPELLSGQPNRAEVDYWIFTDVRYWMEYSGKYPQFWDEWLHQAPRTTQPFEEAKARDVEKFLASEDDRLMLRSQYALDEMGITLPNNVRVVHVPTSDLGGEDPLAAPIVLVKESSSANQ